MLLMHYYENVRKKCDNNTHNFVKCYLENVCIFIMNAKSCKTADT